MELNGTYFLNPAHLELSRARYFLKDENGQVIEKDIDDVFVRCVNYIYQNDQDHIAEALRYRREKKIIDAGRPLAQAGTKTNNLLNCFVIGFEDDTREAISDLKRKHFAIQAQGGGTGINFSTLRPHGCVCKKTQSRSSGAVGFITDFSYQSSNISQGGNRSGANMGIMEDWHPDLYEFITKKSTSNWENIRRFASVCDEDAFAYFQWQQPHQWQMFNVSVFLSDAFMHGMEKGGSEKWMLNWKGEEWHMWKFKATRGPATGKEYERIITVTAPNEEMAWYKASAEIPFFNNDHVKLIEGPYDMTIAEWFNILCRNAWEDGCPGIIFKDMAKRFHNGEYFNKIEGTNPCVTKDTWVLTNKGPKKVADLIDTGFDAIVDGKAHKCNTGFFKTGNTNVLELNTDKGYRVRVTPNHLIMTENGWKEAGQLVSGDKIVLNNHQRVGFGPTNEEEFAEGYLLGHIVGDGVISDKKCVMSVWENENNNLQSVKSQVVACINRLKLKRRSDFDEWADIRRNGESRLTLKSLKDLATKYDIGKDKVLSEKIELSSSEFYIGFIRAFFDTDGSVQGSQEHGVSIRLSQSDKNRLEVVQRMLLRLGIVSSLVKRKEAGAELFPDGKGGEKTYNTKTKYELIISNSNIKVFADRIGFADAEKNIKMLQSLRNYKRALNKESFTAKITDIVLGGIEEVYDATVEDVHAFDANGFYVHNCAEQVLPRDSVCCLTSLVLPSFFVDGEFQWDDFGKATAQAVRGLDNIISLNATGEKSIDENSLKERRIGLGTTGIAELLLLCKLKYSSQKGRNFVAKILEVMRDKAYEASIQLAIEKGSFPAFDYEGIAKSEFFQTLPDSIKQSIKEHGLRNVTILTQAPTGTTGTMVGFSQGCEPYFAMCFLRNSRVGSFHDGSPAFMVWLKENNIDYKDYGFNIVALRAKVKVPEYFEEAHEISWMDHLKMQAVFSKYVDSSVSKTINLPNDATIEDVKRAYLMAYKLGIKSTTIYRDGSKQQILEHIVKDAEKKRPHDIVRAHAPKRPAELPCDIYHTTVKGETWTVLVGIMNDRPYEVFCAPQESFEISPKYKKGTVIKNGGGQYHLDMGDFKLKNISGFLKNDEHRVITRLISTCLRHGVPMPFISDQLAKADGTVVDFSKAILRVLKKYDDPDMNTADRVCSNCGSSNMVVNSGCPECLDCGNSKCG